MTDRIDINLAFPDGAGRMPGRRETLTGKQVSALRTLIGELAVRDDPGTQQVILLLGRVGKEPEDFRRHIPAAKVRVLDEALDDLSKLDTAGAA